MQMMNRQQFLEHCFHSIFSALPSTLPQVKEWQELSFGGSKFVYKGMLGSSWEAIKVCPLNPELGSALAARAQLEINILKQCKSPYIVKLGQIEPQIQHIQNLDVLIYSEEYLEGQSLQSLMDKNYTPPEEELKLLFKCLLEAIKETSAYGLIHRDIKPGNIIKNESASSFTLIDFSIALLIQQGSSHLTSTGQSSPKTQIYAAPELFKEDYHALVNYRTDLYCMAYTIFSYAIGKPYFQTLQDIIEEKTCPLLSNIRPEISLGFSQLLAKLLKKDPNLRSGNIDKLRGEFEAL